MPNNLACSIVSELGFNEGIIRCSRIWIFIFVIEE